MTNSPKSIKNGISIFYEIEQEKLLLDSKKISLFTRHPVSLGTFRERRLRQYPLQFFTTGYYNQIDFKLNDGRVPGDGGLFSANSGTIKAWSRHFSLNSEGYEDQ